MAFERRFNAIRFCCFYLKKVFQKIAYVAQNHYLYNK